MGDTDVLRALRGMVRAARTPPRCPPPGRSSRAVRPRPLGLARGARPALGRGAGSVRQPCRERKLRARPRWLARLQGEPPPRAAALFARSRGARELGG